MDIKLRSPQTAHHEYWEHNNCPHVYEYDPTDDGPETYTARAILAAHTVLDIGNERLLTTLRFLIRRDYQR